MTGCSEISVINYQSTLRKIPKGQRSEILYKIFLKIWTFYGISFIQGVNRLKTLDHSVRKTILMSLIYFFYVWNIH